MIPTPARAFAIAGLLTSLLTAPPAHPLTRSFTGPGSIQDALDAAAPGDIIDLPAGTYLEDLDFGGKPVTLRGSGPHTVIRGTGNGPVITFASGEGTDSVLDSLTVTGGAAVAGGGLLIDNGSSPTIVRCTITGNRASSSGSGVQISGGGSPRLFNNVLSYNTRDSSGDPHGIQISGSSPVVVNNTIVRGDSNGILIGGGSTAVILNNIIAWNGARVDGKARGRGICDFSGGAATIANNVFHKNKVSALLRGGKDWGRIAKFQKKNPDDDGVFDNVDGKPGFFRRAPKSVTKLSCLDLLVCDNRPGQAVDAGCEDAACDDLDGSRNTAGHMGGPYAAGSRLVPDEEACGVPR
jgi:parallel beta-helix repeat protein